MAQIIISHAVPAPKCNLLNNNIAVDALCIHYWNDINRLWPMSWILVIHRSDCHLVIISRNRNMQNVHSAPKRFVVIKKLTYFCFKCFYLTIFLSWNRAVPSPTPCSFFFIWLHLNPEWTCNVICVISHCMYLVLKART